MNKKKQVLNITSVYASAGVICVYLNIVLTLQKNYFFILILNKKNIKNKNQL